MARATIDDVAKRARVTKSTVSHALSGKRPVSEETRRRIEEAIAALGYRPNPVAQRLAAGRSGAVGFVYPLGRYGVAGPEVEVLQAASEAVSAAGLAFVLLAQPDPEAVELRTLVDSGLLEGVILGHVQSRDERVRALCGAHAPFVMMGRTADNGGLNFVDGDVDAAVEDAVERLLSLGPQRIAFLHEDANASATASRALQAWERTAARRRIRSSTPVCPPSAVEARAVAGALLSQHPDLTALAAWGDAAALGACRAAADLGKDVPGDLSVVCLGQTALGNLAGVELTGVDLRYGEQARQAVEMLLALLGRTPPDDRQVLIEPRWIAGETLASPRE